jgi:putative addiction module CopG family antidote
MTFPIALDPQSEELIQRLLDTGRYDSPTAVVRDALQVLEDEETRK